MQRVHTAYLQLVSFPKLNGKTMILTGRSPIMPKQRR